MSAMAMLRHALIAIVMSLALPAVAAPCAGFTDVTDTDPFCPNVAWMKSRGITTGCTGTLYCPGQAVSRLAMAAFINRLGDVVLPPNVIWVAPVGGQFQSIQAAIDYVFANGKTPAVIKVAPGTYNELITLRPYVRIEGSGKQLTRIQPAGCATANASVVTMAGSAQIQDVMIVTTACSNAILFYSPPAVLASFVDSAVRDVDIIMAGGAISGVRITGNISSVGPIERIRMSFLGTPNYGVFADADFVKITLADIDIALPGSIGDTGVKLGGTGIIANLARIAVAPNISATSFGLDASSATVRIRDSILYGNTAIRSTSATVLVSYTGLSGTNSGAGITCVYAYNANTMTPVVC
jgi:hypothetical protein